jgi:hypothetical protein
VFLLTKGKGVPTSGKPSKSGIPSQAAQNLYNRSGGSFGATKQAFSHQINDEGEVSKGVGKKPGSLLMGVGPSDLFHIASRHCLTAADFSPAISAVFPLMSRQRKSELATYCSMNVEINSVPDATAQILRDHLSIDTTWGKNMRQTMRSFNCGDYSRVSPTSLCVMSRRSSSLLMDQILSGLVDLSWRAATASSRFPPGL